MSCSGWSKVIAGAQLVAQAAAKQASKDAAKSSTRVANHAMDLGAKATVSSAQVAALQQTIQNLIVQQLANAYYTSAGDNSTSSNHQHDYNPLRLDEQPTAPVDLKGYDWANHELERIQQQKSRDLATFQHEEAKDPTTTTAEHAGQDEEFVASSSRAQSISTMTSSTTAINESVEQPSVRSNKAVYNNNQRQDGGCAASHDSTVQAPSAATTDNLVAAENQIIAADDDDTISFPDEHVDDSFVRLQEGSPVPSTRFGRAMGFASLGAGLAYGTAMEGISRLAGKSSKSDSSSSSSSSIVMNDSNSDRLAASLCRMRGAALKMGQMLSIQDEALLPEPLVRALQQVRQGANAMPRYQLVKQLESQLGSDWRDLFVDFDELPFAAASIGQVHRATIQDGDELKNVVVKIQYPGVASSIKSDLRNLGMLVKWTGLAPKGLFIENVMRVGEKELQVECDYRREMLNQRRIKSLVENDSVLTANKFVVPDVMMHLTSEQVLTSTYMTGGTIDKAAHLKQEERNRIGRSILYLTIKELFEWRFMQTDPNWGNFLYDSKTQTTSLIDFGATREFSKEFVDGYLRIVWASANKDEDALLKQSYTMGFLTGEENAQMIRAHKLSGYTVGEPFHKDAPFDFRGSNISTRMGEHTSVFLSHRLTPPPEEVYTLHRKLAGAYMLCIKLGAVVRCRDMLEDVVRSHDFKDGPPPRI